MNKVINKVIRVGLYIRVSTEEQARHGYSIESQRTRLKEFSKEKNYQIVDIYADEGKTARTKLSNRKELLRLLEDVKKDKIDRIIIWRLDRWFRNVADYYKVQEILDKNNVDWECTDEDYNTTTSNGRLYLNMKLSIAQNESDQTSDRIKFNFEIMVKNKRPISGALPVGYIVAGEKQNKRVVKDPDLEQMAIDMFDKFEETLSLRATTDYLNQNYPFRPITYERVKKHLKNTLYYGCYRGVENYCEPYITFERHKKIYDLIMKNHKQVSKSNHVFIFSGLIKCYDCNRRMSGSTARRKHVDGEIVEYGTYKCCKHFLDCQCSNNHVINENKLERWLFDNFLNELNNYVISIEKIEEKKTVKNNRNKLKELNSRLDRLNDLYLNGRITKDKYEKEYTNIQNKISKQKEIKDIPKVKDLSKYKKTLNNNNILDLYSKLTPENKRKFWFEYIDYIMQDEEKGFIIFFK